MRSLPLDRVARLGVYSKTSHITKDSLWEAVTAEAKELGFQGEFLAGARSHFTELNRNQHSARQDADAVTYSITPQMHATELRGHHRHAGHANPHSRRRTAHQQGPTAAYRPGHPCAPLQRRRHPTACARRASGQRCSARHTIRRSLAVGQHHGTHPSRDSFNQLRNSFQTWLPGRAAPTAARRSARTGSPGNREPGPKPSWCTPSGHLKEYSPSFGNLTADSIAVSLRPLGCAC